LPGPVHRVAGADFQEHVVAVVAPDAAGHAFDDEACRDSGRRLACIVAIVGKQAIGLVLGQDVGGTLGVDADRVERAVTGMPRGMLAGWDDGAAPVSTGTTSPLSLPTNHNRPRTTTATTAMRDCCRRLNIWDGLLWSQVSGERPPV
jgi:hypothetical protein